MKKFMTYAVAGIWLIGLCGVSYSAAYLTAKYTALGYVKLTMKVLNIA